ncbi:MAG: SMP-30/gluconolactonase/LRE family protein [Blastocatellia bacterium]|nr:SMP-30/gluconolactonase/LRE family protein [Blastocatellia bacterium]
MRKILLTLLVLLLPSVATVFLYYAIKTKPTATSRDAIGRVTTLAGAGHPGIEDGPASQASFSDPFGVVSDRRGNIIVADGGQSNRIRRITPEGKVETIAGSTEGFADGRARSAAFNTPSGIAVDKRGNLIIADTSNNRIRKLTFDGSVSTVAGSGATGYKDGPAADAQFDGPIGVALDAQGNIFVADTYNDLIRKISPDGQVTTFAGAGSPGFKDGPAAAAKFDTPCGIAVDGQGNIFVADAGNRAIRKITPQGEVTTLSDPQGAPLAVGRPIALTVTHDGFLFVADESDGRIYRITPESQVSIFAGSETGFADGTGSAARFNGPSGIALDSAGNLYVADRRNHSIRKISPAPQASNGSATTQEPGPFVQPSNENTSAASDSIIPRISADLPGIDQNFPWPLNPQGRQREVTGVMGEARGAPDGTALDHLHSGIDIRGNFGEAALSVFDEKVSSPVPNWDLGSLGEGIQIGLMSYIHIRVGRDMNDEVLSPDRFKPLTDEAGKVIRVRVRRGTRFRVGDFIGTLNRLYHVHLNFGPWNAEANPLQLPFLDFKDTVAPVVEPDGIEVLDSTGRPFEQKRDGRLIIRGDVDIVVTAYDRADGNTSARKLGLYRVGYQLLKEDGTPAHGFEEPIINMQFHRMPPGNRPAFLVYAPGSGVSAYGTPTKFRYIVTNRVRDGEARDGFLRTAGLESGNYILRIIAEDFAGNRASGASAELAIAIESR